MACFLSDLIHPAQRSHATLWTGFASWKVVPIPFEIAARAYVNTVIIEHPALALGAVFVGTGVTTIPGQVTIGAVPHSPIVQPVDVSATFGTTQARRMKFTHPVKISFDLLKFARSAAFTEFLPQPNVRHLLALAVVAAIHATTQGENIGWVSPRTILATQWNPMVMGERVPQTARAFTNCTFVAPIFQRDVPILFCKVVGEFAFTEHIGRLRTL